MLDRKKTAEMVECEDSEFAADAYAHKHMRMSDGDVCFIEVFEGAGQWRCWCITAVDVGMPWPGYLVRLTTAKAARRFLKFKGVL
jgi:hypothetical protein